MNRKRRKSVRYDTLQPSKKQRTISINDESPQKNVLYNKHSSTLKQYTKHIKLQNMEFHCNIINYNNEIWIQFSHISRHFYQPFPQRWNWRQYLREYTMQNDLDKNNFVRQFDFWYMSEQGFNLFMHWCRYEENFDNHEIYVNRFRIRELLFGTKFDFDYNKFHNYCICIACGYEDIDENFDNNVCDCTISIHLNCSVLRTNKSILNDKNYVCNFCLNELGTKQAVLERRKNQKEKENPDLYEIEKIIFAVPRTEEYFVKYDKYPIQAGQHQSWENVGYHTLLEYSKTKKQLKGVQGTHLKKLKQMYNESKQNISPKSLSIETTSISSLISIPISSIPSSNKEKSIYPHFIPKKITDYMKSEYIINEQVLTPNTNAFKENYIKKLKKKDKNLIKIQIPNMPVLKGVSVNSLKSKINKFIGKNGGKMHKNVTIGKIIDINNPAYIYHKNGGIHKDALGIFATKNIKKFEVLLEYSGIVRTYGNAKKVNKISLQNQLNESSFFELNGNLLNPDKHIFGDNDDDQFVIDPIDYHNQAPYINDYRTNIYSDVSTRSQNVAFVEVLIDQWPRVFCITIAHVKAGDEILSNYSIGWWKIFRELLQQKDEIEQIKNEVKNEIKNELEKKHDKIIDNLKKKYEKEIQKLKNELLNKEQQSYK